MINGYMKCGETEKATELFSKMPTKNEISWTIMVSGYVQAGLDKEALKLFHEMQAADIHAAAKEWELAAKARRQMKEHGVLKFPGCSTISLNSIVHEFLAGDRTHPEAGTIYSTWNQIADRLLQEGYKPVTRELMLDLEDSEKETVVSQHSEKLAITFGLIHGKPGTVIRIFKNLRVCEDCHTAMKLISRIYNRQIVMRDRTRFHCFRDGECSCADYW
ncbi:Pentatricopeptide repeat-containing protein At5g66520 [Linum perenne]